jgi:hypothetical protein
MLATVRGTQQDPNFVPPPTNVTPSSSFGIVQSVQTAENGGNRTG